MSDMATFILGCIVGFLAGGVIPAYLQYRRAMREPPKIEIKVDKAMLSQLNEALVMAWLDSRGLMWMPKGVDFRPKVPKA